MATKTFLNDKMMILVFRSLAYATQRLGVSSVVPVLLLTASVQADIGLLKEHCGKCHTGRDPKGAFSLHELAAFPNTDNSAYWISSLERVEAGEMPPVKHSRMTSDEVERLVRFLRQQIALYEERIQKPLHSPPRRLNNREFENSLCQVLGIEHVGSHGPLKGLLGDTLHEGFDTHGATLGLSEYHLDQYVTAVREVLDGVIVTGPKPTPLSMRIIGDGMRIVDEHHRKRKDATHRSNGGAEIRDPGAMMALDDFPTVPETGWYNIRVRAKVLDRHIYDQALTGVYDDDPVKLRMHLGVRRLDFVLPEAEVGEFEQSVWLVRGTSVELSFPTDGLRLIGNGNFKFQNRIAHDYIKANNPELFQRVLRDEVPKATYRSEQPAHWVHWVPHWQGPRPWIESVDIHGPSFNTWPSQRQTALLGKSPSAKDAAEILKPIAERAWRRPVSDEELAPIVQLVQDQADTLGEVGALKEGIVAILVSPSFLLINPEGSAPEFRFATKLGFFLDSTTPDADLIAKVRQGKLDSFVEVRDELQQRLARGGMESLLREFPYGWLQLDRINFMAPDIDRYPLYEKKRVNEDMVDEVLTFFRHAVEHNRPVPELLTADYSFINADLAKVYQVDDVPSDSTFRKVTFDDGRRGGFLGMGAFLTLTADTLSTSPIHRAVYVMENFMGIHPAPPPADVEITEPDVRTARTIREVLAAHQSDATCAACHQNIDPFGYAFENFDPIGAWREMYVDPTARTDDSSSEDDGKNKAGQARRGKNQRRREQLASIPIDASATFLSGAEYKDIREFRELMNSDASRQRFVRCFITKMLTYANGIEPKSFSEVEAIVNRSAEHDYRIVETIAAVIDSPLFRESKR